MPATDPRVDAYINKAADFAKPIMQHLRKLVHTACPEVVETIKWNFPNFEYMGGVICSMAAFKQHCAFTFWKAALINDTEGILQLADRAAMGQFDKITSLTDLPSDKIMVAYLKQAAKLNEDKVKVPRKKTTEKKDLTVPADLLSALKTNKTAKAAFEAFSPSHKNEYIEWLNEAKTETTRKKRLETAIEWISEGKSRNWKYMRK